MHFFRASAYQDFPQGRVKRSVVDEENGAAGVKATDFAFALRTTPPHTPPTLLKFTPRSRRLGKVGESDCV